MKTVKMILASCFIAVVLAGSALAGEVNTGPAPQPPPSGQTTVVPVSSPPAADSTASGDASTILTWIDMLLHLAV